jgi:asparagine synthase (glutamine-hydrolysing)
MSVLAGVWNFNGEPVSREFLARMSQATAEYGPDGQATHVADGIGLLYRALHTTSESRLERQPYSFGAEKMLMWNGRLDNRADLIQQLQDTANSDLTDVAIVASAFERWGTNCFSRLIGDWALSIWDERERELILARDYMGIRHLFYYPKQNGVVWCTHLNPLALLGDQLTVCDEYIAGYLAFFPDAHLTPYREIQSVPPGQFVCISHTQTTVNSYWSFGSHPKTRHKTDADYEEHFRHLFRQAVHRRLRADSPVLADLSGGLDSSSIVCMADDIFTKEGAEAPGVDTFSYYDGNEPGEDDFAHLTKVEDKRGKRGLHVDLKGVGDSLSLDYPAFVATPGFGCRSELKAALSDLIRKGKYRVMLAGTGGDEMNGQPLDPCLLMADMLIDLRFADLAKHLMSWSLLSKRPLIQLLLQSLAQLVPVTVRSKMLEQGKLEPWINRRFARHHRISARQMGDVRGLRLFRPGIRDARQTFIALTRHMTYLAPSVVEVRYPYLDQTLVEFLSTIPLDQLLRPGQRRSLMRRALASILPAEILSRKTKAAAARCYSVSLEKHWDTVERMFASPLSCRLGYLDRHKVCVSLAAMKNGQMPTHSLRLLKALSLELWLREVATRGIVAFQSPLTAALGLIPHEKGGENNDLQQTPTFGSG